MQTPNVSSESVSAIDWSKWVPTEKAVLCFIVDKTKILLMNKKTGLGTGKVNAPGGRIEKGETPLEAAIRETEEEVLLTPGDLTETGELFFQFTNGYKLHGTVFIARSHTGTPTETREADPFWCDLDKIPYDKMWQDDHYWLPLVLSGTYATGYFVFDDDRMLSHRVEHRPL